MAYLSIWRESIPRLKQGIRYCTQHIPSDCPLCRCSARGGRLCDSCRLWVTQSMNSGQPRCPVCCLALPQAEPCPDCASLQPAYDKVIAAFDYHEPGDLLIHRLKSQRNFSMAPMLAGLLVQAIQRAPLSLAKNTIVLCVPASRASVLRRGFNPAAAVARSLASQLDLPYQPQLLRRAREGAKQAHLSRTERARSTQSLYACTGYIPGAHIAVVDDVLTTGSTLQGIARQLRAAGAASVCGLVLARTPYRPGVYPLDVV
ncbi:ComF family protein [Alcaligenaceae bacterium]|nr:ComF family protein [Alcaligenaceae bacterium]